MDEFTGLTLLPGSGAILFILLINQLFYPQCWSSDLCDETSFNSFR